MHSKISRRACSGGLFFRAATAPARAIPIFAQRYRLHCGACHSVLPELNAFGNYFRMHGYRLPIEKHGTTMFAIRYQMSYAQDPAAGTRRWTPGGILLGNADVGNISLYMHYSLGAGGGPSGLYLGFLTDYNAHTKSEYRFGLFELPLAQSPGERLDDLQPYGYYGAHVGLNDLPLASPRWGMWDERTIGNLRADLTFAVGRFQRRGVRRKAGRYRGVDLSLPARGRVLAGSRRLLEEQSGARLRRRVS